MARKDLSALQSSIREQSYDWEAAQTSLSELTVEEQTSRLGLAVNEAELAATQEAIAATERLHALSAPFDLPAAVDWRNKGGNWTTPIKDQQSCGSCVAFATVATLESRIKIVCRNASLTPDLSEAHLFYCGCGNCCATGWNFAPALDFCKTTGVGLESSFPYTPGNQPCRAGVPPYAKLTSWQSVVGIADRKNALANKGPVVAGLAIYSDFFSYRNGVYKRTAGSVLRGYHAVSVVGYDDAQACWIAKNSWGAGWGDAGWFKIGYGESGIDTSFNFYDADLVCPVPRDTCQIYGPYLTRVLTAAAANPALRLCLRYYVCGRGPRPRCSLAHVRLVQAVVTILRKCPQYRKAFCARLG